MTTYCLGEFAKQLARQPVTQEAFRAALAEQPETCPRDCKWHCRAVCREYALTQWKCVQRNARKDK